MNTQLNTKQIDALQVARLCGMLISTTEKRHAQGAHPSTIKALVNRGYLVESEPGGDYWLTPNGFDVATNSLEDFFAKTVDSDFISWLPGTMVVGKVNGAFYRVLHESSYKGLYRVQDTNSGEFSYMSWFDVTLLGTTDVLSREIDPAPVVEPTVAAETETAPESLPVAEPESLVAENKPDLTLAEVVAFSRFTYVLDVVIDCQEIKNRHDLEAFEAALIDALQQTPAYAAFCAEFQEGKETASHIQGVKLYVNQVDQPTLKGWRRLAKGLAVKVGRGAFGTEKDSAIHAKALECRFEIPYTVKV